MTAQANTSDATARSVELERIHRYWNAANYLTVAQIYLQANPLLREPLKADHIKPRLLGHWGTSPGLSLVYVHLNRLIRRTATPMLLVTGPGHGGPAIVANTYLDGSYTERFEEVTRDEEGLLRLVRQFSTPGGISSHVGPSTPGSIHEGGELGYALAHAAGVAFDNPELIVACIIGDGEAETGPLAGSWQTHRFLDPARDGAVLPILHLNGYKIAGPTVLGTLSDDAVGAYLSGQGWEPVFVSGDESMAVHERLAGVLEDTHARIRAIQERARGGGADGTAVRWPVIVLRTPKGWTGPDRVDDEQVQGTFRSHQVPLSGVRNDPDHLAQLEAWMRSYRPEELFDDRGRLIDELAALAPEGDLRLGSSPEAHGGSNARPLVVRPAHDYAVELSSRGLPRVETTRPLGEMLRDIYLDNADPARFRLFSPDETNSNRLGAVFEVENRCLNGDPGEDPGAHVAADGRVMEVLSEHLCQGWLEGYTLSGRHGLFATYEAFAMISASMLVQHVKWLQHAREMPWRRPVPSLDILLTSTCWRNDHNGFSHQGPGLIDTALSLSGDVVGVYLPPDTNTLLVTARRCFAGENHVNLIVVDKQEHPQWLDIDEAQQHVDAGASIWSWAGTPGAFVPDIVLACVGDIPTAETLAASWLLQRWVPGLRVRVVNVVDLMTIAPPDVHPHGMDHDSFEALFTDDVHVVVAWHGYARSFHQLLHGRSHPERFHVRGYNERGTTTTPFDMVVLNRMSRYHLVLEALDRVGSVTDETEALRRHCETMLARHTEYVVEHLEDMPEIRDWTWTDPTV